MEGQQRTSGISVGSDRELAWRLQQRVAFGVGGSQQPPGPRFRYDHGHAMLMTRGGRPLDLHGGRVPWEPAIPTRPSAHPRVRGADAQMTDTVADEAG